MSIEKITSKILEEAEIQKNAILNKAQEKKSAQIKDEEEKAKHREEKAEELGKKEKDKIISQKQSVADIDARKMELEIKQDIIASCFQRAMTKVLELDKADYINYLIKMLKETGLKQGEITLNQRDIDRLGNELIEKANGELEANFVLSEEAGKFKGGLLLKNGKVYINGSLELAVDEAKEKLS